MRRRRTLRGTVHTCSPAELQEIEALLPVCECGGRMQVVDEPENLALWVACGSCEHAYPADAVMR